MVTTASKKPGVFYGWWVVLAGAIVLFISFGISVYSRQVFFNAMFTELKINRGPLSLAMSIGSLLGSLLSPFIGAWVDRHGAARVIALSGLLSGLVTMSMSRIYTLWHAYIIYTLYAIVQVGIMFVPVQVTISHWFTRRRGRAMGFAMAGVGLGGFVFAPFTAYLVQTIGWRTAWIVCGAIMCAVIVPVALLFIKPNPQSMGLLPDGDTPEEARTNGTKQVKTSQTGSVRWTTRDALKQPVFWLLALSWLVFYFAEGGVMAHGFTMYRDKGIPAMTASMLVSFSALSSFLGKVVLGWLCEKVHVRYVMTGTLLLFAFSAFLIVTGPSWVVYPFVFLYGFSMGGTTGIQPLMVGSTFGLAAMGSILGTLSICSSISHMFAGPVTGYIYDATLSYNLAFVSYIAVLIPGALVTFLARAPRKKEPEVNLAPATGKGA